MRVSGGGEHLARNFETDFRTGTRRSQTMRTDPKIALTSPSSLASTGTG